MKKLMIATTALCVALGAASAAVAKEAKSPAELKADMTRIYTHAWNKGDMKVLDELIAADVVDHEHMPGKVAGLAGAKKTFQMFRAAFPDLKTTPVKIVVEGDYIMAYYWMEGTNKGAFMGMPATHKRFKVEGFDMVRVKNGKAVEHWGVVDQAAMMRQLGHMPADQLGKGMSKKNAHGHDHGHDSADTVPASDH